MLVKKICKEDKLVLCYYLDLFLNFSIIINCVYFNYCFFLGRVYLL